MKRKKLTNKNNKIIDFSKVLKERKANNRKVLTNQTLRKYLEKQGIELDKLIKQ